MTDHDANLNEPVAQEAQRKRKGIYLLPSLITTASMLCGFYAIITVFNGNVYSAAWAILLGGVFDSLDGKVARLTGTVSDFGSDYDSLSDLMTFGIAPGLLVYAWELQPFGRIGYMAAFLFVVCGALRLARFNNLDKNVRNQFFIGLPIPAAAMVLASLVILTKDLLFWDRIPPTVMVVLVVLLAYLMISNIKYRSFKDIDFTQRKPFRLFVAAVLAAYVVMTIPELMIFLIAITYAASGPVEWLYYNNRNIGLSDIKGLLHRD